MADSHLSRRALLGAISTLPVIALAAQAQAQPIGADRGEWDRKFALLQRTRTEATAASAADDAAYARYITIKPSTDIVKMGAFPCMDRDHVARVLDLEVSWRRFLDGEGKWWFAADADAYKARTRADFDSVREFRRLDQEARRVSGYEQTSDTYERLSQAECDALHDLIQTPAPDGAALLWKLEELFGGEENNEDGFSPSWSGDTVAGFMSDARRLLAHGRA